MKRLIPQHSEHYPKLVFSIKLVGCSLMAAAVVLVFFAPRYVAWSGFELPESWSNPEINRAIETLRLIEDPFGYQPSPSNRIIVWRLLFVLPWHYLSLPIMGFILMPFVGCVAVLMFIAYLLYRESASWRITVCGTALAATCSWFFVSTGWLTYFDSWVLLGLLAIGFLRHLWWGIAMCLLVPWIDERFVLSMPLILLTRAMYFDFCAVDKIIRWLKDSAMYLAALLPWFLTRSILHLVGYDRGITDVYAGEQVTFDVLRTIPTYRLLDGWWMGLRMGWVLLPIGVWLWPNNKRIAWYLALSIICLGTLAIALFAAGDMSRSMSMFVPLMLVCAILLIRHRPTWAGWVIPLLLLLNLALPARHVVWSFDIKMINLRQAVALDRNPPSMFSAAGYVDEALVQAELGQRERAISFLDKAIELDSQYAPAYIHRAVLRSRNKDSAGAMEDARVGINLTPQAPEGYWVRGQLLAVESQWADALRDFEKVQSMISDSHPLYQQCKDAILKAQMKLNPQPAAP